MERKRFDWLVVDSSGFINCSDIHELADNLVTIPEVMDEIKDQATRERINRLPYPLKFKEPRPEDVKLILQFARKTGDYACLSAVDVKLMALTYALDKEAHGGKDDHLNKEPVVKVAVNELAKVKQSEVPVVKLPGFYVPKGSEKETRSRGPSECVSIIGKDESGDEGKKDDSEAINGREDQQKNAMESSESIQKVEDRADGDKESHDERRQSNHEDDGKENEYREMEKSQDSDNDQNSSDDEEENEDKEGDNIGDEEDDDDNEDSWITPSNLREMEAKMENMLLEQEQCPVACITSDYSIQNVLIQMGLKVASVKGLIIRRTKQFVLRCHACFKITSHMDRKFCPSCGNLGTLKRVSVHVNENGEKIVQINFRRPINTRGMRYSLPMPKGGKHSNDPILFEDQRIPQNKASKLTCTERKVLNCKTILSDPDYVVRSSPFAVKDVYSRASRFAKNQKLAYTGRRNPNEVGRPTGNKKKSKSK